MSVEEEKEGESLAEKYPEITETWHPEKNGVLPLKWFPMAASVI